jgi:hypothetical protein
MPSSPSHAAHSRRSPKFQVIMRGPVRLHKTRCGIPGCAIATEAFQPAAAAQARTLGFDPALHWVPHPIQNRTPEELAAIADGAIDDVLKLISA